jgi:hypothetical protein
VGPEKVEKNFSTLYPFFKSRFPLAKKTDLIEERKSWTSIGPNVPDSFLGKFFPFSFPQP